MAFWENPGVEPEAAPDEGTPAEPEAAAEPEAEAVEAVEETLAQQERPRDEHGRFAKAEPDDAAEEARLLAGRYKSVDELERALLEKEAFIQRQTLEVGEKRKLEERLAQIEQGLQTAQSRPNVTVTADLIEQNPGYAAEVAYQSNDEATLRAAFDAWKDEDPAAAASWVASKQIERVQQQYEQKFQDLESRLAPLAVSDADREFNRQLRDFEAQHGPIADLAARAEQLNLPSETTQTFATLLDSGTPEQKIGVFKTLALLVGSTEERRTADTLQAARSIAREQALEADRAIQDASVVSATASKVDTPQKTAADLIGDQWEALDAPYRDGWNI